MECNLGCKILRVQVPNYWGFTVQIPQSEFGFGYIPEMDSEGKAFVSHPTL